MAVMEINNNGHALSMNLWVLRLKSVSYFFEYCLYFKVKLRLETKHPIRKLSINAMRYRSMLRSVPAVNYWNWQQLLPMRKIRHNSPSPMALYSGFLLRSWYKNLLMSMLKVRNSGIKMTVMLINKLLNSHDLRFGLFLN